MVEIRDLLLDGLPLVRIGYRRVAAHELDRLGDRLDIAVVAQRRAHVGDLLMREQAQAARVREQREARDARLAEVRLAEAAVDDDGAAGSRWRYAARAIRSQKSSQLRPAYVLPP